MPMFDNAKFKVDLTIERVTRIPYSSGRVHIKWNVPDSPRPDAHGTTKSSGLHKNEAVIDSHVSFRQRIRLRSTSRYLSHCPLKFEVFWEPPGGHGVNIGTLTLDLSQFAKPQRQSSQSWTARRDSIMASGTEAAAKHAKFFNDLYNKHDGGSKRKSGESSCRQNDKDETDDDDDERRVHKNHGPKEHSDVYDKPMLYLLEGARNNCLLKLKIKVDYISGVDDYKPVEFDGPAMNNELGEDAPLEDAITDNMYGPQRGRERLRKLKKAVFHDFMVADPVHSKNSADADWLDFDSFLMGKQVRVNKSDLDPEFQKNHISDVSDLSFENHKKGTPYLESEIRENFINWNIMHT